jgi:hypothetical protein
MYCATIKSSLTIVGSMVKRYLLEFDIMPSHGAVIMICGFKLRLFICMFILFSALNDDCLNVVVTPFDKDFSYVLLLISFA